MMSFDHGRLDVAGIGDVLGQISSWGKPNYLFHGYTAGPAIPEKFDLSPATDSCWSAGHPGYSMPRQTRGCASVLWGRPGIPKLMEGFRQPQANSSQSLKTRSSRLKHEFNIVPPVYF